MAIINTSTPKNEAAVAHVAYLVEEQANPSADFFVLPALAAAGWRVVRCGFSDLPATKDLKGSVVVFVRYVPLAWARLVESVQLHSLIFFMDDDVLDVHASIGMPWRYRFKLARLAAWRTTWLREQKAQLWVSTPYLQEKYARWQPQLVLPSPVGVASDVCRVFYHGSASHNAEIDWLYPIMEEVLRCDEQVTFEIVGGRDVYRLYRGLPRVNVVHPMKWPAYQNFLSLGVRHIGLAPLLDLPFNRARSYTKFYDFTRCGAVGIYSPDSECAAVVSHEIDGLIIPLDQEVWVSAILGLARDKSLRQKLQYNATLKSGVLAREVRQSYLWLIDE